MSTGHLLSCSLTSSEAAWILGSLSLCQLVLLLASILGLLKQCRRVPQLGVWFAFLTVLCGYVWPVLPVPGPVILRLSELFLRSVVELAPPPTLPRGSGVLVRGSSLHHQVVMVA